MFWGSVRQRNGDRLRRGEEGVNPEDHGYSIARARLAILSLVKSHAPTEFLTVLKPGLD